jgi:hypothetical protein
LSDDEEGDDSKEASAKVDAQEKSQKEEEVKDAQSQKEASSDKSSSSTSALSADNIGSQNGIGNLSPNQSPSNDKEAEVNDEHQKTKKKGSVVDTDALLDISNMQGSLTKESVSSPKQNVNARTKHLSLPAASNKTTTPKKKSTNKAQEKGVTSVNEADVNASLSLKETTSTKSSSPTTALPNIGNSQNTEEESLDRTTKSISATSANVAIGKENNDDYAESQSQDYFTDRSNSDEESQAEDSNSENNNDSIISEDYPTDVPEMAEASTQMDESMLQTLSTTVKLEEDTTGDNEDAGETKDTSDTMNSTMNSNPDSHSSPVASCKRSTNTNTTSTLNEESCEEYKDSEVHEDGSALGDSHLNSNTSAFLPEPQLSSESFETEQGQGTKRKRRRPANYSPNLQSAQKRKSNTEGLERKERSKTGNEAGETINVRDVGYKFKKYFPSYRGWYDGEVVKILKQTLQIH